MRLSIMQNINLIPEFVKCQSS